MDYLSENTAPVHPAVAEAVTAANIGYAVNFERENWTERALDKLKAAFETDLDAFTVSTGTAANAIALGAMTPPWGGILCHWDSHIETDECGAPAMFTAGARQIPIAGDHGKIDCKALADYLAQAPFGVVHSVQPAVLSLTQLTESGTAYSADELRELCRIARTHGLLVHMDGARFANAVVSCGATLAELSWKAGVDVLALGTTKSGTYGAEVVIAFNRALSTKLAFVRKRSGHFSPKSRFLAAQVEAYLDGELWRRNATNGNAMAARLAKGLAAMDGVQLVHPTHGNEVLVALPEHVADRISSAGIKFHRNWRLAPVRHHRFVMSWAAKAADVDATIAAARG
jgi:threonine aldolase